MKDLIEEYQRWYTTQINTPGGAHISSTSLLLFAILQELQHGNRKS